MMCLATDISAQIEEHLPGEEDYRFLSTVGRRREGRVGGRSGRWGAADLRDPRCWSGRRAVRGAGAVAARRCSAARRRPQWQRAPGWPGRARA